MAITNPYTAPQAEVADVDGAYHGAFQEMKIWGWRGRLGRLRFLAYGAVAYLIFAVAVGGAAGALSGARAAGSGVILWVLLVPYLVFLTSVMIRRSHDMGWSGWMSLLGFIPLVGLIWVFKPGSRGANEYGAPPPPNGTGVKIAAFGIFGVMIVGIVAAIALPAYQQYVHRAQAAKVLQAN